MDRGRLGAFRDFASIGGSWLIARRAVLTERASDAHVSAVNALLPALARLRALTHESTVRNLDSREVASAINAMEDLCMQHDAALPASVRSTRRNVRAAAVHYFGGSSLAALDAEMASYPVSEPDPY